MSIRWNPANVIEKESNPQLGYCFSQASISERKMLSSRSANLLLRAFEILTKLQPNQALAV